MIDFQNARMSFIINSNGVVDCIDLRDTALQIAEKIRRNPKERHNLISVHFIDNVVRTVKLGRLWILITIWTVPCTFGIVFQWNDYAINTCEHITGGVLHATFDTVVDHLQTARVNLEEFSSVLALCLRDINYIAAFSNDVNGNTVNLYDLVVASEKDPELDALLNIVIPPMQPKLIERFLKDATTRLSQLLIHHNTCFAPYLKSQTGLNPDQLCQTFIAVGMKPTYSGDQPIAHVINRSYTNGLAEMSDMLVSATAARKAMMIKQRNVPDSGHVQRQLQYLTVDALMNPDCHDCGSKHLVPINILTHKTARNLVGRYYVTESGDYRSLQVRDIEWAVGKTLSFRSPIGCREPICRTCYGEQADINYDVHAGITAMLLLTNVLTQKLLSAKHLLKTDTTLIEFTEPFSEYFYIDVNEIHVLDDSNVENVTIRIYAEDIQLDPELSLLETIERFYLIINDTEVEIESSTPLSLSSIWNLDEMNVHLDVALSDIRGEESCVFFALVQNRDIGYTLKTVQSLIMRKQHGGYNTLQATSESKGLLNACIEVFEEIGLNIGTVHLELILAQLMYTLDEPARRFYLRNYPNEPGFPQYQLLSVPGAIRNGPNFTRALFFEDTRAVLTDPNSLLPTGHRNDESSLLEELYT